MNSSEISPKNVLPVAIGDAKESRSPLKSDELGIAGESGGEPVEESGDGWSWVINFT